MIELNRTEIALRLAIKLLLSSGLLGSIIGIITLLSNISNMNHLGQNLAVSFLTVLYSILIVFILLPVQAKIKSMIITMDKEYIDEETAK
jgi:flagellar motor component MotA